MIRKNRMKRLKDLEIEIGRLADGNGEIIIIGALCHDPPYTSI
jgi:hypothetical protein